MRGELQFFEVALLIDEAGYEASSDDAQVICRCDSNPSQRHETKRKIQPESKNSIHEAEPVRCDESKTRRAERQRRCLSLLCLFRPKWSMRCACLKAPASGEWSNWKLRRVRRKGGPRPHLPHLPHLHTWLPRSMDLRGARVDPSCSLATDARKVCDTSPTNASCSQASPRVSPATIHSS